MAFQQNLSASIYMFSFFRSHGSDVSYDSGFFQGYAWCSLCFCSCRLTTRMRSLEMFPYTHTTSGFFFGNNPDFTGGIFDL